MSPIRSIIEDINVAFAHDEKNFGYPLNPPFLPDEKFPELQCHVSKGEEPNIIYHLIRKLFLSLGYDKDYFSTSNWNPLGEIIQPGNTVLVKPNMVRHVHLGGGDLNALITHGSIIRCVLDYVAIALKGRGEIIVGDSPLQSANFDSLINLTGLDRIVQNVESSWGVPVRIADFRLRSIIVDKFHNVVDDCSLTGDTQGYNSVNLGTSSLLDELKEHCDLFRVTCYDSTTMREHHSPGKHEYLIPSSVLKADVVLNLPKLKTHRKAGITAALKNLVGINGHKDWLPHHRKGSVNDGGDEYLNPSFWKRMETGLGEKIDRSPNKFSNYTLNHLRRLAHRISLKIDKDSFFEGSWYGNDTVWRTALDLNRLLIYANKEGIITKSPQRKCLTLVDAIISGEGEGPVHADSKLTSFLLAGTNPVAVDCIAATIMGFDYRKIPLLHGSYSLMDLPLVKFQPTDIYLHSIDSLWNGSRVDMMRNKYSFRPPSGWIGHIEAK